VSSNLVFAGTEDYYARYRPDYPPALYEALTAHFALDGSGRLLDLGAGTGHVALALRDRFEGVDGVDMSTAMLAYARQDAADRGVTDIDWHESTAEDFQAAAGVYRLVTIGNAVHWMDGDGVLARCHQWVQAGGGVALLDMPGLWNPDMGIGDEPWIAALSEVVRRHLGERRRAGSGYYQGVARSHEELLRDSPFKEVSSGSTTAIVTWTLDEVVGYLYSTSFANRDILGDRVDAFESDLRATLIALEPSGRFPRTLEATWTCGQR
jgi:ubiquinone/menaquinone biosynthesis C-methylase UbiE